MNKVLQVPFVDLAAQYAAIKEEVDEAMASVLRRRRPSFAVLSAGQPVCQKMLESWHVPNAKRASWCAMGSMTSKPRPVETVHELITETSPFYRSDLQ